MYKYNLVKLANGIGFRVSFDMKAVLNDKKIVNIEIEKNENLILENSDLFLQTGIYYFFEKFKKGFDVEINNIRLMPVDTTNMLLMYAVIESLTVALDFKIEGLCITEKGLFSIPK
ncbi:hypothetical protein [Flavobacterium subsaxonicum]|uniref:Uncharacterized protein n=1 Tax=Flavobacterium subsaxonicum WB 4.1-42 = DSM 21790 TaxID=1121898 RepID=A0A0A2ML72_9FLAO|nr:hypothetical protein [Flavobacterium subsaxonicum]KGO92193.1 hypothetical protein Q766_13605 [Flavobacterium subsaxonicum WB 4.1-42 = DSM 21790]